MKFISLLAILCALATTPAYAQQTSTTLYGALGLNTIPSARMNEAGTIRAGISTLDPYLHSFIGLQLADPLYINIRQSAEISALNDDAKHLYPGVDIKLRLAKESARQPEIALGLQSIIGHKRMAGEYISASKRHNNLDFTAGIGWGRFASAKHFDNPLTLLGDHFDKPRALDGEMPNQPNDWFTGEHIGLFAGLEYFTSLKGLSLKFDYGADRYAAETQSIDGFHAPAPWSAGFNYKPKSWIDIGVAAQGTDKIMGRVSFQNNIKNWRKNDAQLNKKPKTPFHDTRKDYTFPPAMIQNAKEERTKLYNVKTTPNTATADLALKSNASTPHQLGIAAKNIANHSEQSIEQITITPTNLSLRGPQIQLNRISLERAATNANGSAQEIWHATQILPQTGKAFKTQKRKSTESFGIENYFISLDTQASLSEEDSGTLYRTSLVAGTQSPKLFGIIDNFLSLRLNIANNLDDLNDTRTQTLLPVRSDIDQFADQTIAIDTAFSAFTHSFNENLHLSLMGGYLEEQYAGAGGEILYRPHDARWALGAETFLALKRDPTQSLNAGLNGDHLLSGHLNGWYDVPAFDVTAYAKVGRYLAEDIGGTIGLQKEFKNGAKLEAYTTLTNAADFDQFGGTTHADHGLRLTLPLGGYKYIPQNTNSTFTIKPFGRDIGQNLNNPIPLYDLTTPFNTKHIAAHWGDITN